MKLKIFFMKLSRKIVSLRQKQRYLRVGKVSKKLSDLIFEEEKKI